MKSSKSWPYITLLIGSVGLMLAATVGTASAQAVVSCPVGYSYSYGYGCIPVATAYGSIYGGPVFYDGFAPVYDSFGFAFGGRDFHHGFHRGGFRGGDFHGGGFHGGGHR
jgi:hypothetical protein